MTLQHNMDIQYHLLEIGPTTHGHSVVSRLLAILHDLPALMPERGKYEAEYV